MNSSPFTEDMTVEEVGKWLVDKGYSEEVRESFEREEMDGEAVLGALGCQVGPDCLKAILPKYGQRIKVYNTIKAAVGTVPPQEDGFSEPLSSSDSRSTSNETGASPMSSVCSQRSSMSSSSGRSQARDHKPKFAKKCALPDPFPVPLFRQSTEENLANEIFYPDDRKYMVRVLATMILTHTSKASVSDCEYVAKALVQKFPFLKEYESWASFIYVRCQNCNRKPSGGESKPKKPKIEETAKHSYPHLRGEPEDETTHGRNIKLLQEEIDSRKPNCANMKSLMSRTFLHRREWILNSEIAISEVLEKYPCLCKISHLLHEMDMISNVEKSYSTFEQSWTRYAEAILQYSSTAPAKTNELKMVLKCLCDDEDDDDEMFNNVDAVDGLTEKKCIAALKCLASFLIAKPKKRDEKQSSYTTIPYLLLDVPNSTPTAEYLDSRNNYPYIVRLYDGDCSVASTYKIIIEQEEITKCSDMTMAIYLTFSLHYIFNISYHVKLTDYFNFFQEVIFEMPCMKTKKSAPYSNFCAAIEAIAKKLE